MIDLFYPFIPKEGIEAVSDCLRGRWVGQGPKVDEFEREFAKLFRQSYVVALNSGTAALESAYDLVGIGPGDEVISTPLTCTATNLELLRRGAKIVWADILEDTLCINPLDVRAKVTEKTKAAVQVHLGGIKADIGFLHAGIPVISDAAQGLGIFTGDYTCCSFQAIKHITTGDGGMLAIDDNGEKSLKDYKKAKLLRWFGIDREKKIANNWQAYKERKMTFDIELAGTKRHMNDIAASLGLIGLKYYDYQLNYRRVLFDQYKSSLKDFDGLKIIDGLENKYWLFTVLVERRDDFARALFEAGIDSNVVQVRNDIYKIFGGKRQDLPVMNAVEEKYLSLPLGMHVSEEDVGYICAVIKCGW